MKMQGPAMQSLMRQLPRAERRSCSCTCRSSCSSQARNLFSGFPFPGFPGTAAGRRTSRPGACSRSEGVAGKPDVARSTARRPKVGFVSLGCPKALVDSERILTQLRAEGYDIAPDYAGADLVVVNTCGFIDAAVEESLDAIGEALAENGKVIVTGCLGAKGDVVRKTHPGGARRHRPARAPTR